MLVNLTAHRMCSVTAPRTELRVISSSVLATHGRRRPRNGSRRPPTDTDVSSLVAPIGGLATYPSMVLDNDSPEQVLSAVAHEWLHQYLIFYPLGAGYWRRQETREINETTADWSARRSAPESPVELGLAQRPPAPHGSLRPGSGRAFDFRAFMRETRQQTEQMLAAGQVDAAEAYMRVQRDELERHGYQIRKLNQAYFALYGSYGDGFAASPANPIPGLLRTAARAERVARRLSDSRRTDNDGRRATQPWSDRARPRASQHRLAGVVGQDRTRAPGRARPRGSPAAST